MPHNTYGARKFMLEVLLREHSLDREALEECEKQRIADELSLAEVLVSEAVITDQQLGLLLEKFADEGHISPAELSLLMNEFPANWQRWKEMEERDDEVAARAGKAGLPDHLETEAISPVAMLEEAEDEEVHDDSMHEALHELIEDDIGVLSEVTKEGRPFSERVARGSLQEATDRLLREETEKRAPIEAGQDTPTDRGGESNDMQEILEGLMAQAPVREYSSKRMRDVAELTGADPLIGRTVGGAKIVAVVGEGQSGTVYKGIAEGIGKPVAVRVVRADMMNESRRTRMLESAQAATKIEHRNVAEVSSAIEEDGNIYVVSGFAEGVTLRSKLRLESKLPQEEALDVVLQVARALRAGHDKGVYHGDVKPENVFIDKQGLVTVTDFGLTKSVEIDKDTASKQSLFMGTPHYMAPEQFEAKQPDARTDVYSLGVTLYEMFTGVLPFDGKTAFAIRDAHLEGAPKLITEIDNRLDSTVAKFVAKMIAKNPDDRYQEMTELVNDMVDLKQYVTTEGAEPPVGLHLPTGPEMDPEVRARAKKYKTIAVEPGKDEARKPKRGYIIALAVAVVGAIGVLAFTFLLKPYLFKPQLTLEEEATRSFRDLKRETDILLSTQEYFTALRKLDTFPKKFANTQAQQQLNVYRDMIFAEANKSFALLKQRVSEFYKMERIGDARRLNRALMVRAQQIFNTYEEAWPKAAALKEYADFASKIDADTTVTQEMLRMFPQDMESAEELLEQDEVAEALKKMERYLKSAIAKHRAEAEKLARRIAERKKVLEKEAAKRAELDIFRKAIEAAREDLSRGDFDKALTHIEPFKDSKQQRIIIEVIGVRAEIEQARKKHLARKEEEARQEKFRSEHDYGHSLIKQGKYEEVVGIVAKYENDQRLTEEEKKALSKLKSDLKHHLAFAEDFKTIESLLSEKKFNEARRKCAVWLLNPNKKLREIANKKFLEIMDAREPGMAYILGGAAVLGSDDAPDKNPSRKQVYSTFYIDRHEVTCTQYKKFVQATNHRPPANWLQGSMPANWANLPVTGITWEDAGSYAKWARKRLPTDVEWEIAASWDGENKLPYPWGKQYVHGNANIAGGKLKPVGTQAKDKSVNGVFDMAGNAAEWTATKSKETYIVRGSSAEKAAKAKSAKTTRRSFQPANTTSNFLGFRCAKDTD